MVSPAAEPGPGTALVRPWYVPGTAVGWQAVRTRVLVSRSGAVAQTQYLSLTATCRATQGQRFDLFDGSRAAASSPLGWLAGQSEASKLSGSLAGADRLPTAHVAPPFCQASDTVTTWSMSTSPARTFLLSYGADETAVPPGPPEVAGTM